LEVGLLSASYTGGVDTNSIVVASGAIIVPVTALLLNYRGFASLERRLEVIERDLKDFYKASAEHDKEIARLKDHTGLK
jgi:hypothetical protein